MPAGGTGRNWGPNSTSWEEIGSGVPVPLEQELPGEVVRCLIHKGCRGAAPLPTRAAAPKPIRKGALAHLLPTKSPEETGMCSWDISVFN